MGHGLWDASRGIAVWLTLLLTATRVQWLLIEGGWMPAPTPTQVQVFSFLSWGLLALDALLGLLLLRGRLREAVTADGVRPGRRARRPWRRRGDEVRQLMGLYPQPRNRRPSVEYLPIPYGDRSADGREGSRPLPGPRSRR